MAHSNPKTAADERFETYLSEHGIAFKYEPDWDKEFGVEVDDNPDYLVDPAGVRAICEVKQFESRRITERLLQTPGQAGWISYREEFGPIRLKVTQTAREQLAPFKGVGVPLVVVLANPLNADVDLDEYTVTRALLGNPKITIPVGPEGPIDALVTEKAEDYGALICIQPDGTIVNHHPFLSAVVVVEQWPPTEQVSEESERWVHVYDASGNPTPPGFNGIPLPRAVFSGARDRWYGFTGERFGKIG